MKKRATMLAVAGVLLAGCETTNVDGRTVGTALGAVGGAIVGSQFGSGAGRVVATLVGGAAGAWLGNQIAGLLAEPDQQRASAAVQESAVSGQNTTWRNPESGVSGRTRVVETRTEPARRIAVPTVKDRIETMPPLAIIGSDHRATSSANVRGGPGTDYRVVGRLDAGQTVEVIGRVDGKPWMLIGQNGAAAGFVSEALLRPVPEAAPAERASALRERATRQEEARSRGEVVEQVVPASARCRTIEQEIVLADGRTLTETTRACLGPNGWQVEA
jgi:surface antigen